MKAKMAFESYAKTHGVYIQKYHADTGDAFINDIMNKNNAYSFAQSAPTIKMTYVRSK